MNARLNTQELELLDQSWLRDTMMREQPVNLALQRLQSRVLKSAKTSEIITSYDRMHHRHNRS